VECARRNGTQACPAVLQRLPGMTKQDDLGALPPSRWQATVAAGPVVDGGRHGLSELKRASSKVTYTPVYATHDAQPGSGTSSLRSSAPEPGCQGGRRLSSPPPEEKSLPTSVQRTKCPRVSQRCGLLAD